MRGGRYQLCEAPTSSAQGRWTTSCLVVSGSSKARFIPLSLTGLRVLLWRLNTAVPVDCDRWVAVI